VLGVILNNRLTATDHIDQLLSSCSSLLYALRVLRSHGVPSTSLQDVFRASVVAKIIYCAPASAWAGICSAADRLRLDRFLNRCKRTGFCATDLPSVTELYNDADDALFETIMSNSAHTLQPYLPERPELTYNVTRKCRVAVGIFSLCALELEICLGGIPPLPVNVAKNRCREKG